MTRTAWIAGWLGAALIWGLAAPAAAQRGLADQLARSLGPKPAQVAARGALADRLETAVRVRWDPATGTPSAVRFDPPVAVPAAASGSAPQAAAWILEQVGPLYAGLPPVGESEGAWLERTGHGGLGAHRYLVFRQRLDLAIVDGSTLVLDFTRGDDGRILARGTSGRVWRDLPVAVAAIGAPSAASRRAGEPTRVVTPRPDGVWKQAWETVELVDLVATRVLRDAAGQVLFHESLDAHGQAEAFVYPEQGASPRRVAVPDLRVQVGDRVHTTDEAGAFPGDSARAPWGFAGTHERVLVRSGDYPQANRSGLLLMNPDPNGPQLAEANVYVHLARFRRYLASFLPRAAWDAHVVALVHYDEPDRINASASPRGMQIEGRVYDYTLTFGHGTAEDPTVIAHERTHAALFSLGFRGRYGGDADALHEAYADFLAACYQGSPVIGAETLGNGRRNIDDDRVYPQNLTGTFHRDSVIFSGALWDARRELGPRVEAIAMAAVTPALGSATMPAAAERLLELCGDAERQTLRRHLVAHGLIRETVPPVVEVRDRGRETVAVELETEAQQSLALEAYTPNALGEVSSNLTFLLDGPDFVTVVGQRDQLTGTGSRTLPVRAAELVISPGPDDGGSYEITITAMNAQSGESTTRAIQLSVIGVEVAEQERSRPLVELEAQVGVRHAFDLPTLFPQLEGVETPYRFRFSGAPAASATIIGETLFVQARAGEEGLHQLELHGEPAELARSRDRIIAVDLHLLVVSDEAPGPALIHAAYTERRLTLPPGQTVTAIAGGRTELEIRAVTGTLDAGGRYTLALIDGPAMVSFSVGTGLRGFLTIQPPASITQPRATAIHLEVRDPGGAVVARRVIPVAVLPQPKAPPAPEAGWSGWEGEVEPDRAPKGGMVKVLEQVAGELHGERR